MFMLDEQERSLVRVEKYRTRAGEEFTIGRRARSGRRCQRPKETGERLECPFCGDVHPVLYYIMQAGKASERKVRTWECPRTGRMSLNINPRFQDYISTITVHTELADVTLESVVGSESVGEKAIPGSKPNQDGQTNTPKPANPYGRCGNLSKHEQERTGLIKQLSDEVMAFRNETKSASMKAKSSEDRAMRAEEKVQALEKKAEALNMAARMESPLRLYVKRRTVERKR